MRHIISRVFGATALMLSIKAFAHFPTLSCQLDSNNKQQLICTAGFSDASLAGEVSLKVYSYDDELLQSITTKSDGSAEIPKPQGEFYIVFDAGHETPAEFDYAELQ